MKKASIKPLVLHCISGMGIGGAERVLLRLIKTNKDFRHAVVSLTSGGELEGDFRYHAESIKILDFKNYRTFHREICQLIRFIKDVSPDLVQSWMYHSDLLGGLAAWLVGVPVVWGLRNSTFGPGSSNATRAVRRLCARLSSFIPEKIISCSFVAVAEHVRVGYKKDKFEVIPNGVDLTEFRCWSAQRFQHGTQFVVGMLARLHLQKDYPNFVTAVSILRGRGLPIRGYIKGLGVDLSNPALPICVRDAIESGFLTLDQNLGAASAFFGQIDLNVLSSAYGEAFPNVLAEAMASGVPCVATDVGDAQVIVGSTGWIVPPNDSVALADAIQKAFYEWGSKEWLARQAAARDRIKRRFSLDEMCSRYSSCWSEVIARS